jgi:hypothetical protein
VTPTVYIHDDRGRRLPLFDERRAQKSPDDAEAVHATMKGYGGGDGSWNRDLTRDEIIAYGGMPFLMLGSLLGWRWLVGGTMPTYVEWGFGLALGSGLGWIGRLVLRHTRAGHVRESLLRAGRCPSCGYSLAALVAEPDGCVVCPECSGAWMKGQTS